MGTAEALIPWIVHAFTLFIAGATLAPMVSTGAWWVRVFDFPKLQLLWASVLPVALSAVCLAAWDRLLWIDLAVLGASALWNTRRIAPFTRAWPLESPHLNASPSPTTFTLMISNLRVENDRHAELLRRISDADPDVLLVIENDDRWHEALAPLEQSYPHRVCEPRDEGLGMALYSRLQLRGASMKTLVSDRRVSIHTEMRVGDAWVRFVGVHPTPPGLADDTGDARHDSRVRDAELVLVARQVAESPDDVWIIAGDFNDVAWSHTTRLFKRLSGLCDPRVGRRLMTTYHAQRPLLRYPVDHVFVSPGVRVGKLERQAIPGSDHFAVIGAFDIGSSDAAAPEPEGDDRKESREMVREGHQDAYERGAAPRAPRAALS